MDVSPDGKIGIALRSDPSSPNTAFLTTFDPISGAQMDSESFGFGPLGVQLAQVGNSLRAVALTSQGGPRAIYLFDVSASGQLTQITSKQLTTSINDGGSNIVLSGASQTGFTIVYPAAGNGAELITFSLVDGAVLNRLPIPGISDTLAMSERPNSRLLAFRTGDNLQIVNATNPALPVSSGTIPLPRNTEFSAFLVDGIVFSADARYVFVGNHFYDFAAIDLTTMQVVDTIGGNYRFGRIRIYEDGQRRLLAIQSSTAGFGGVPAILLVDATDPANLVIINQHNFTSPDSFSYKSDFAFTGNGSRLVVAIKQNLIAFDLPNFTRAWERPIAVSVLQEQQLLVYGQPEEVLGAWEAVGGLGFISMFGAFPAFPPTISVSDAIVTEGDGGPTAASFSITLSAASAHRLTLSYFTADGNAVQGSDYVFAFTTVTFEPGETSKLIKVSIVGDSLDEFDEAFSLNLLNQNLGIIVDGQGVCTIADDDPPPAISINNVSVNEGNSGTRNAIFTVGLSAPSGKPITVTYATEDGSATGGTDYTAKSGTLMFPEGSTSLSVSVIVNGDSVGEADETFFVRLTNPLNATLGDDEGVGTIVNDESSVQFSSLNTAVGENAGAAMIVVTLTGTSNFEITVNYATSDTAGLTNCSVINGVASSRCDYATSVGTVRFAAGETVKTISIPIVNDGYAEGNENFTISLTNSSGAIVGAGATATVTINDNETVNGPNPIDQTPFFVRQQYVDFLGREPDPGGGAAWEAVINTCPAGDTTCDRIHVSSAFFRSAEFQGRGYFIYRFYPVAFGRKPDFVEFIPDLAKVSGFLSDAELEAAKVAFITEFLSRPAFVTKYNGLNDTQYVDTLLATAQVSSPHRDFWIAALGNGTRTRATVLRDISESPEVYNKYYNQAFVVMQYFGYLRRDPDALYLNWINVLDTTGDFRGMVNGFMNSLEYRFRFGP